MPQRPRLKILLCGESSFLSSGYSVYQHRLLSRLAENPHLHVAELGCYSNVNDPRDSVCNWRFYANCVSDKDARYETYKAHPQNNFGKWRFDKIIADFRPDVVIDIRDYWMNAYQRLSPWRKYFHWILMPTIDSAPQQEEWLDTYMNCDAVFTYSDWARDILQNQTGGKIKYIDTCSPGFDPEFLYFSGDISRAEHRAQLGIENDIVVIGTVMRNQKRKLYAELIRDFRKLLENLKQENHKNYNNTFLYLHTSYPDFLCWDIPKLLKEFRMLNRTLFTYYCERCNSVFSSLYNGPITLCRKCKDKSAKMPSVTSGVSRMQLGKIYSSFDLYVQYSICEGFGMPQIEAASCGVPVLTVNYSAMEDVVKKIDAYPIDVKYKFRELETFADRAYPDSDSFVNQVKEFLNLERLNQALKMINTTHRCYKHYKWSDSLDKWEKYLMSLYDSGYAANYNHIPERIANISITELEQFKSNMDKAQYIFNKISAYNFGDYPLLEMLNRINYEFLLENGSLRSYQLANALNSANLLIDNHNSVIDYLMDPSELNDDYIQYAHMKDPVV